MGSTFVVTDQESLPNRSWSSCGSGETIDNPDIRLRRSNVSACGSGGTIDNPEIRLRRSNVSACGSGETIDNPENMFSDHWGRIEKIPFRRRGAVAITECRAASMPVSLFSFSLLCGIYEDFGGIDSVSLCFLSIMPEVVAREIALFSVSGQIESMENVESSLWPLRRALADVEETNPFDDEWVNPQLLPSLTTLCRTAQAIIDGVLVEIRLRCSSNLDLDEISRAQRVAPMAGLRQQCARRRRRDRSPMRDDDDHYFRCWRITPVRACDRAAHEVSMIGSDTTCRVNNRENTSM